MSARSLAPRLRRVSLAVLALALVAVTIEILIHHYDPTRVIYKRLKAPSRYTYDEIDPALREVDPRSLIQIETAADVARVRASLIDVIWGRRGFPVDRQPSLVEEDVEDDVFSGLPNLARIDRLTVDMGDDVRSHPLWLHPEEANGRIILYHHGYAGTVHDMAHLIAALVENGYAVLAINLMGYGGTSDTAPSIDGPRVNLHFALDRIESPLRYHFEPVVVGLNHVLGSDRDAAADMIGFSAGGFITAVAAAIDTRIVRSYPVAGVYPIYLRTGQDILVEGPPYYPPMLEAASYLDMFVLGAAGERRRQLQVFNRYDRCCFNNTKGRLYEPAVKEALEKVGLGGGFGVLIDETHADHKISRFAVDALLADLRRP